MNDNTAYASAVTALVIGLIVGFFIGTPVGPNMNHTMSDGSVMSNASSTSMEHAMISMNGGLVGKTGSDFDKAFLTEMIVHHQGAVDMAELALTSAKNKEIKDLAGNIIASQNTEIANMKGWLQSWYK
jgi:uncharacterized protein (DUF305 family)